MKTYTVNQEILLITTTSYSQIQWCEKNASDSSCNLSPAEQLEAACWNGLLSELLPGIVETSTAGKTLFLWGTRHGRCFIEIELCEYSLFIEKQFSIDPYSFLYVASYN